MPIVTSGVFRALGVAPQLGSLLTPADDRPGAPARVVLSDSFWRNLFGADPEWWAGSFSLTGRRTRLRE